MNIEISSIVSEINGKTAMNLLDFILNNEDEVDEHLAKKLIITRIKASTEEVVEVMEGIFTFFQRKLMQKVINHIQWMIEQISELDELVDEYLTEYDEALKRLETILGIAKTNAEIILSEIGLDMNQFPTARHIASWVGVAPGNNKSAGKRKNAKTTKGNKILKNYLSSSRKISR